MGLGKKTIDDENYAGKRVLVRCDFNVPMKDGVITNENRINAALPTIKKLIADGAKVILCSHLGKPKNGPEAKFSLAPVAVRLSEKLGQPVTFADDDNVVGNQAKAAVATMGNGDVVLLQNTRFRKEETKNIDTFSEELASLADAYVDDAFGSCHRAHCSTAGVTNYVKDTAVGYLMEKEINYIGKTLENPQHPFVAIIGGAKVSDKIGVISNMTGGILSDRVGYVRILRITQLCLFPAVALFVAAGNPWLSAALLIPVSFCIYASYSPMVILGQTYLARNLGFSAGITLGVSRSAGGIALPLVGLIADHWGLNEALLCLLVPVAVGIVSACMLPQKEPQE